jgi:hypothetical protein
MNRLEAWEKRTGKKLDRRDSDAVLAAFKEQDDYEKGEALRIQRELQEKRDRAERLREEIRELESAAEKAKKALRAAPMRKR